MKRRFQIVQERAPQEGESILPMINVVFLMLIFFMVAGVLTSPDMFKISPPVSFLDRNNKHSELVLYIDQDGTVGFEGELLQLTALDQKLRSMVKSSSNSQIQIKADLNTPSGKVIQVMEVLREVGFSETRLVTIRDHFE